MKKKQTIKCDVDNCTHHNCDDACCDLDEITVSCNCSDATNEDDTICEDFEKDEEKEDE